MSVQYKKTSSNKDLIDDLGNISGQNIENFIIEINIGKLDVFVKISQ